MPMDVAMWQVPGRKGDASIYLEAYNVENRYNDRRDLEDLPMALIVGKEMVIISPKVSLYRSLLIFAEQRYNGRLDRKQFKHKKDLINYILDKETAKQ